MPVLKIAAVAVGALVFLPKLLGAKGGALSSLLGLGKDTDGTSQLSPRQYFKAITESEEKYHEEAKAMEKKYKKTMKQLKSDFKNGAIDRNDYEARVNALDKAYKDNAKLLYDDYTAYQKNCERRLAGEKVSPAGSGSGRTEAASSSSIQDALSKPSYDQMGHPTHISGADAAIRGEHYGKARYISGVESSGRKPEAEAKAITEALRHPVIVRKESTNINTANLEPVYHIGGFGGADAFQGRENMGYNNARSAVLKSFYHDSKATESKDFQVYLHGSKGSAMPADGEHVGYLFKSGSAGWVVVDKAGLEHIAKVNGLEIKDGIASVKGQGQAVNGQSVARAEGYKSQVPGEVVYKSDGKTQDGKTVFYSRNVAGAAAALSKMLGDGVDVRSVCEIKGLSEMPAAGVDPKTGNAVSYSRYYVVSEGGSPVLKSDRELVLQSNPDGVYSFNKAVEAVDRASVALKAQGGVQGLEGDKVPHQGFLARHDGEGLSFYGNGVLLGTLSMNAAGGSAGGLDVQLTASGKDFKIGDTTLGQALSGGNDLVSVMEGIMNFMTSKGNMEMMRNSISLQNDMQQTLAQENAQARAMNMGEGLSLSAS